MSFGFSVGDFVACMLLINDVTQALKSSTGSASEVKALVAQLDGLMLALMSAASIHQQMKSIEIGPESKAAADVMSNSMQLEYERCKDVLQGFKDSLRPYEDAFVTGRASALTRHVRKVTWLFRKDDIVKFEKNLGGHLKALNMYKTALSEIYAATTAKNSELMLSSIVDLRVEVNKISSAIVQQQPQIPRTLGYSWEANFTLADTIILIDAIGRTVVLPLVLLGSANDMREILLVMYRTIEIGRQKILSNEYTITDEDSDGVLLDETNWNSSIQAGMQLTLNIVVPAAESFNDNFCPQCSEQTLGRTLPGQRKRCHKCQLTFRIFDKERFVDETENRDPTDREGEDKPTNTITGEEKQIATELSCRSNRISSVTAQKYSIFKSVHYHREIRRIRPIAGANSAKEHVRVLKIDELPPLHKAAATCNLIEIDRLIGTGTNIDESLPYNTQNDRQKDGRVEDFEFKGCSPLLLACWFGQVKAINKLIKLGANIHSCDSGGAGALHYACHSDNPERVFPLLLKYGADTSVRDKYGATAFHDACRTGLAWSIQLFLDRGAKIDDQTADGFTPLQISALRNRSDVFDILVDQGASIDICHGKIPLLHCAVYGNSLQIVQTILDNGVDPSLQDEDGDSSLNLAVLSGYAEIVEFLLSRGMDVTHRNKSGETVMHQAAFGGYENIMRMLIERGAELDPCNSLGDRPLGFAAIMGHYSLVKLLLEAGASVKLKGEGGRTVLNEASYLGHQEIVATLLANGADVDEVDDDGRTALHQSSFQGHTEVLRLLLEAGADVKLKDSWGRTSLNEAAFLGHREIVATLLTNGADVDEVDDDGRTALHRACFRGQMEVVKLLLEHGAKFLSDSEGRHPIHDASYNGNGLVVKILLERYENPNAKFRTGQTPLHWAANKGNMDALRLLIEAGADPNIQDDGGETALHHACHEWNMDVITLLLENGSKTSIPDGYGDTFLDLVERKLGPFGTTASDASDDEDMTSILLEDF